MTDTGASRPDGPISGILFDYGLQLRAAGRHALAEGHDVGTRTVLDSYDRTLHPWMHGRRPHDLAERYGDEIEALGFGIGAVLGIVIDGPALLARKLWRWIS